MEMYKMNLRLLLALLLFVTLAAACGGVGSSSPPVRDSRPTTYQVQYRLTMRGSVDEADVTLRNETGATEQLEVDVPYTKRMTLNAGDFAYISAQKLQRGGEITCEIVVNGEVVSTATSDADYGIAQCSGSVGE